MVWYSHLFQNFPKFIVIHTVEGFGIVNKAEIAVFLEVSCFFDDPADVGNLISGSSTFSKTSLNILYALCEKLIYPKSRAQTHLPKFTETSLNKGKRKIQSNLTRNSYALSLGS